MPHPGVVVTVSDRSSAGLRPDASGPVVVAALRDAGFACADAVVVPDGADSVEQALRAAVAGGALIVTTGGTGLPPRDETPEAPAACSSGRSPASRRSFGGAVSRKSPRACSRAVSRVSCAARSS